MKNPNTRAPLRLRIWKTDGRVGNYTQAMPNKAAVLVKRLNPQTIFTASVLVIGTLNPITLISSSEVAWIEVESSLPCPRRPLPGVDECTKIETREEFDQLLLQQWPKWRKQRKGKPGDLLQSLVELTFRGGLQLHLHVRGVVIENFALEALFQEPAITASLPGGGTLYVNPKSLVRARIYHSNQELNYPSGIFVAEADEI